MKKIIAMIIKTALIMINNGSRFVIVIIMTIRKIKT